MSAAKDRKVTAFIVFHFFQQVHKSAMIHGFALIDWTILTTSIIVSMTLFAKLTTVLYSVQLLNTVE